MMKLKHLTCAAALTLGVSSAADAATFSKNINDQFTFTLDLDAGESQDTGAFGIAFDFNLTIEGVTGDNPLLGYFVDTPEGRITEETTCSGFGGVGNCDLVFASEEDGTLIFSGLSAGIYNFGVFGGTLLDDASLTFGVSKVSPVPLPAGGLLLLGGLGALGLKRRKDRTKA